MTIENRKTEPFEFNEQNEIYALELSLLESSTRKSIERLNELFADDFYEITACGKVCNKKDTLESLPLEKLEGVYGEITDFKMDKLSEKLIKTSFILKEKQRYTRRTSIWKVNNENCQMIFHQGTVIDEANV